jgi:hypothetical protein
MGKSFAKLLLCSTFIIASKSVLKAQSSDKEKIAVKEKSYFKFDANFLNNSVYLGRKDSLNLPYLTPTIVYTHKGGFYTSASLGYLLSKDSKKIDYYSFDAGYEFTLTKKLSGSISANKSIYNDSSSNVSSSIGGSLSGSLTYDFGFMEMNTGISGSFAEKTDLGFDVTVRRSFYFGEDGKQWSITPLALVNFSTLHFYEGYTNRKIGKRQKNPLITSIVSTTTVTNKNSNNLTLLDAEFSIPVSYDEKKWGIYCTPTLAVPQNAIYTSTKSVITLRNGNVNSPASINSTPDSEKKLASTFYVELGVYFKF